MTTIRKLRIALDQAEANYKSADIEHPTAVHLAKEELTSARFDYWSACAELVTRLPGAIAKQWDVEPEDELAEIYKQITGSPL